MFISKFDPELWLKNIDQHFPPNLDLVLTVVVITQYRLNVFLKKNFERQHGNNEDVEIIKLHSGYDCWLTQLQYAIIQFDRWTSGNIDVFSFALNRKLLQATSSNITHFLQNKKCPDMMLKTNENFHFLRDFLPIFERFLQNTQFFNSFLF